MKLTNKQYDFLNKIHRGILGILASIGAIITVINVLTEQGFAVPHVATITAVLVVIKAVLGELLTLSSKEYWKEITNETESRDEHL